MEQVGIEPPGEWREMAAQDRRPVLVGELAGDRVAGDVEARR
jgi:hypothetical protein